MLETTSHLIGDDQFPLPCTLTTKSSHHAFCASTALAYLPPQLNLDEEDGFQSVVKHMVGPLSIKDEEAFGLDMTRVKDVYRLNGLDYEIVRCAKASVVTQQLCTV